MPRGARERARRRDRGVEGDQEGPKFEPKAPEQKPGFDDLNETKLGKKAEKLSRFAGLGFGGGFGSDDLLKQMEDLDLFSFDLGAADMATLSSQGKQLGSCAQGY